MTRFILIILISSLISCSKPGSNPNPTVLKSVENSVELASINLDSILENDENVLPSYPSPIDFGHLESGQTSIQTISFRNNQQSLLNFSSGDLMKITLNT